VSRHRIAAVLLIAAAVCFGLVLASIYGDNFTANEPALLAGGFFLITCALIVERLT
jgi:hypothetical protein